MTLTVEERENLRKRVKNFTVKNPDIKKSEIVNHYLKEGISQSTIYNILKRLEDGIQIKDLKRTGRPCKLNINKLKKLKRLANNKVGVTSRKLCKIFALHRTTINRNLSKMGIRYRKRQKTPKYTVKQAEKSKKRSRKLVNMLYKSKPQLILDDEKYFLFKGDQMPGNSGFYTDDIKECPDDVKFKGKEKFPQKVLVWLAISEKGLSEPFIATSKSFSINQNTYLKKCLQERLLPFINNKFQNENYIFWPDLASSHYADSVVQWMENNINFVPKDSNPPNVPQARPIENFWGYLANKVYEDDWEAKSKQQLIMRIRKKLKEIDLKI